MYLLQRQGNGSFQLVYRVGRQVPPYAILSHTWAELNDEVTFQNITDGTGTTKPGYRKINFCAEQAAHDGLDYFWIDTCCIDKTSSTELQEAITSMFRWYQESAKCYVYLADVSIDNSAKDGLAFEKSRWFTRGWTLQELLAPKCTEFYSREGKQLGNKSSRMQEISQITRIPIQALEGQALSAFSVQERMAWTEGRETTRDEDMVYSLLGIFDVYMPLLYGEGRENAHKRLQKEMTNSRNIGLVKDIPLRSHHFKLGPSFQTMLHETDDQYCLLMGDSKKNGRPDLIAVKKSGTRDKNIEINVLYGSHNYQRFILRIATPDFTPLLKNWPEQLDCALTDWTGDGTLDLVVIKKCYTDTSRTEVHIFSGASQFQTKLLQIGTVLEETGENWSFGMGRWGGGHKPDLFAIKRFDTGTNSTEVHVLCGDNNYQSYLLQTGTGLHETDSMFNFIVTDWNGDGRPDLVAVKKSRTNGKCTEVHVLSGASTYQNFVLRAELPIYKTSGFYEFAVADWTGNKKPDLIAFKKRDPKAHATEVQIISQLY